MSQAVITSKKLSCFRGGSILFKLEVTLLLSGYTFQSVQKDDSLPEIPGISRNDAAGIPINEYWMVKLQPITGTGISATATTTPMVTVFQDRLQPAGVRKIVVRLGKAQQDQNVLIADGSPEISDYQEPDSTSAGGGGGGLLNNFLNWISGLFSIKKI